LKRTAYETQLHPNLFPVGAAGSLSPLMHTDTPFNAKLPRRRDVKEKDFPGINVN
jgi:hypothetical protein